MTHLLLPDYEGEFTLTQYSRTLSWSEISDQKTQSGGRKRTAKGHPRWIGNYQWGELGSNAQYKVEILQFFFKLGLGDTVDVPVQWAPADSFTSTTVSSIDADDQVTLAVDIGDIPPGVLVCISGSGNRTYEVVSYNATSRELIVLPDLTDVVAVGDSVNHATGIRARIIELKTEGWPGGEGFEGPFDFAWEEDI